MCDKAYLVRLGRLDRQGLLVLPVRRVLAVRLVFQLVDASLGRLVLRVHLVRRVHLQFRWCHNVPTEKVALTWSAGSAWSVWATGST